MDSFLVELKKNLKNDEKLKIKGKTIEIETADVKALTPTVEKILRENGLSGEILKVPRPNSDYFFNLEVEVKDDHAHNVLDFRLFKIALAILAVAAVVVFFRLV